MDAPETRPIGGTDYPTTWVQFLDWFHSERACREYLEKLRWSDGLVCPNCGVIPVELKGYAIEKHPCAFGDAPLLGHFFQSRTLFSAGFWFLAGLFLPFRGMFPPFSGYGAHHRLGGRPTPAEQAAHPGQVVGGAEKVT